MKTHSTLKAILMSLMLACSISAFADVFTWKEGAQGGWDDP